MTSLHCTNTTPVQNRPNSETCLGLVTNTPTAQWIGGDAGTSSSQLGAHEGVEAQGGPRSSDDAAEILRAKYAGLRVLVAEDDIVSAEIERLVLEDIGFKVDSAEDGQEALELAEKTPYQLILMDMQMPRLNGPEATRAIRQLPAHQKTAIVAVTGNAVLEDRMRCVEAGMNGFISKPLRPDKLYAAIFDALENRFTV